MDQASEMMVVGRSTVRPVLLSVLLFLPALLLRLLALGRYVTPDELIWVYRSVLFRQAILAGQWADTLVAGHPGVTTTWLGTVALSLQLALQPAATSTYDWITSLAYLTPDNMEAYRQLYVFLSSGRTAVALVNSLGIVAVYWLVSKLLNGRIAFVAALLLALDPFFAGLSGLLHVDSLLATWSILSLLTLALGVGLGERPAGHRARYAWLAASGVAAALAVLSKTPGLLLLPVAGLVILTTIWLDRDEKIGRRLLFVLAAGVLWLASFAAVLILLYPALWTTPQAVISVLSGNTSRHIDEALRPTFFMGDVAFDHGLLFYPVALVWRIAPLVAGGLILLLALFPRKRESWERYLPLILLLAVWSLLFLAGISLAAKKFDRYLLPVFPALVILAAIPLAAVRRRLAEPLPLLVLVLAAAQLGILLASAPYLLSAYNPLVGGPYTAQHLLPLGWGEGISAGGRWLAEQPGTDLQAALSGTAPSLAPFFPGTTLFTETSDWQQADWVILTASTRQMDPQAMTQADRELDLAQTLRYGLLPQAWIYRNPQPQDQEIVPDPLDHPPSFGGLMRLLGHDIRLDGKDLLFTARWEKERDARLLVNLRLLDSSGRPWQEMETELLNEVYFYPEHWQAQETPRVTYRLRLAPAMPPGSYTVALTLIDQASGGQLPVRTSGGETTAVVYEAGTIQLEQPVGVANLAEVRMVPLPASLWPTEDLQLLGYVQPAPAVLAGSDLQVGLVWQVVGDVDDEQQLGLQLGDNDPVLRALTGGEGQIWQKGWLVSQRYRLPIPPQMKAGDYPVYGVPLDEGGDPLLTERIPLGDVRIDTIDRLFTLPEGIELPLDVRFGPGIMLKGVSPATVAVAPGATMPLTLYWQTEGSTAEPVTAFLHLLDDTDQIVAQVDRWPGGLPSDIWSSGQVIIDAYELALPADLAPGRYRAAVGLYMASDGVRLSAADSENRSLAGDSYQLPLEITVGQ